MNVKTTEVTEPSGQLADSPILSIRDLTVDYIVPGQVVHAVSGVTLDLMPGELLGIVGESGSGKSALLRAIIGLLDVDGVRVSGSVCYQADNLLTLPKAKMRRIAGRVISMVFQDPMTHLNPVMRVGEQVEEALRNDKLMTKRGRRSRALELMRFVGIADADQRVRDYPHQFSGGMRQRVLIAIALACTPRILLADEPTTALDVTVQDQILKLLKRLRTSFGMSMIYVSHDLATVAQTCDRVGVMYAGELVEIAPVRDLIGAPRHPYTIGLMNSHPGELHEGERLLRPIRGNPPDSTEVVKGCRFAERCDYVEEECLVWDTSLLDVSADHKTRCRRWRSVGVAADE